MFGNDRKIDYFCSENVKLNGKMEPKIGETMKVSPSLTGLDEWVEGSVIQVEHNPFQGLVIAIKDKLGRIFFGKSKYFVLV